MNQTEMVLTDDLHASAPSRAQYIFSRGRSTAIAEPTALMSSPEICLKTKSNVVLPVPVPPLIKTLSFQRMASRMRHDCRTHTPAHTACVRKCVRCVCNGAPLRRALAWLGEYPCRERHRESAFSEPVAGWAGATLGAAEAAQRGFWAEEPHKTRGRSCPSLDRLVRQRRVRLRFACRWYSDTWMSAATEGSTSPRIGCEEDLSATPPSRVADLCKRRYLPFGESRKR